MSTANGNPVFETVGGDGSSLLITPTGSTSSVKASDLAASVASNTTDVTTALSTANSANATVNAANTASNTAVKTANAANLIASTALQPASIGASGGVVGLSSTGTLQAPKGATFGASEPAAIPFSYGNTTKATGTVYNWYFVTGTTSPDVTVQIGGGTAGTSNRGNYSIGALNVIPSASGMTNLGVATNYWAGITSQTAVNVVSDLNDKNIVGKIGDAAFSDVTTKLRSIWADISGFVFTLKEGQSGRQHIGVVAQYVADSFQKYGLDAADFGVWCSTPRTETVAVTNPDFPDGPDTYVTRPVYEADGKTQATQQTVRYDELLALGLFCERLERTDLVSRIASLEAKA